MINKKDNNPFQPVFLIDFDLAIKEQQEGPLGAQGKTSIRAFIAIKVLLGEIYLAQYNFKSFFQVLFWICIHYNGLGKDIRPIKFKYQNYESDRKLVGLKKSIADNKGDFLKSIDNNFLPYYQPLIPWVNRLRKVVFLDSRR